MYIGNVRILLTKAWNIYENIYSYIKYNVPGE